MSEDFRPERWRVGGRVSQVVGVDGTDWVWAVRTTGVEDRSASGETGREGTESGVSGAASSLQPRDRCTYPTPRTKGKDGTRGL